MEGDYWRQSVLVADLQYAAVVVECRRRELSFFRLDPSPLQGKPVSGEPEARNESDVLAVAVVVVDGIAGGLGEDGAGKLFKEPGVAVDVVAFNLVGGGGDPQRKSLGGNAAELVMVFLFEA